MALLWMDADGNGISVAETASEVKRRVEEEDAPRFIEFTVDTGGEEDPWRSIYIEHDCIYAIEQGAGSPQ